MSSLAASRADNFYFPPEWRPEMGSISKFQGSKGANQYEQYGIIRFELPFDCWCLGCNRHMCKGLRFNAKKDRAGKYFTTTIWSFNMKCHSCEQRFTIKTDPKNSTYEFVEGIRKMEQDFVPDADDSLIESTSEEKRALLQQDPIFKLQHEKEDKDKADLSKLQIVSLSILNDRNRSDYDMNSLLRKKNRDNRKRDRHLLAEGEKLGIPVPLVPESEEDASLTKKMTFRTKNNNRNSRKKLAEKYIKIQAESIFKQSQNKVITPKIPSAEFAKEEKRQNAVRLLMSHEIQLKRIKRSTE